MTIELHTPESLADDYNWKHAFSYADGSEFAGKPDVSAPELAESDTDTSPFSLTDVEYVFASDEGENDEMSWVAAGRLKDGRWFYLESSCDYTGWD